MYGKIIKLYAFSALFDISDGGSETGITKYKEKRHD
jgi:hypothetical protein